jgi:hypothetical protein
MYFSTLSSFLHVTMLPRMEVIFCFSKICHARVLDSSYHELSFHCSFVPTKIVLEPGVGIIRLISFLCELFTRLTMIQCHAKSMFQILFGLSIRVLPPYYPGLSAYIVSWTRVFKAIVYESRMYGSARVV